MADVDRKSPVTVFQATVAPLAVNLSPKVPKTDKSSSLQGQFEVLPISAPFNSALEPPFNETDPPHGIIVESVTNALARFDMVVLLTFISVTFYAILSWVSVWLGYTRYSCVLPAPRLLGVELSFDAMLWSLEF